MEGMTWVTQVSRPGEKPTIVAEYVLNQLGVFVKRERRVPKKDPLHKLTGFRVGYKAIPGTDYRAAPLDRNAILWQKVTSVDETPDGIRIRGNQKDEILLAVEPGTRDQVLQYIQAMRRSHPLNVAADYDAASWICWRDDDEWTDPYATLSDMIAEELDTERFLEPEVVEETVLPESSVRAPDGPESEEPAKPKFCAACGAKLQPDSRFCEVCGEKVR